MPRKDGLNQKAVWWTVDSLDRHGEPTLNDPVEINVNWQFIQHETSDPKGNTVTADVQILTDCDLSVGDQLWLGKLRNKPTSPTLLYKVVSFDKVPDVKGRRYTRSASLARV